MTPEDSTIPSALTIAEKAYGPGHEKISVLLTNLGGLLEEQGMYHAALPLLERALLIDEAVLGPDHRSVAHTLASLGDAYYDLGRYAEAEAALRRALAIRERVMGPDHKDGAPVLERWRTRPRREREQGKRWLLLATVLDRAMLGIVNHGLTKVTSCEGRFPIGGEAA